VAGAPEAASHEVAPVPHDEERRARHRAVVVAKERQGRPVHADHGIIAANR
jgi:hypothetical protein